MKFRTRNSVFLLIALALVLLSGCGSPGTAVPTEPSPLPTSTPPSSPTPPQPSETGTAEAESSNSALSELEALVPTLANIAPTRTPVPTATPDVLAERISEIVQETGLSGRTLLWLGLADWVNLGFSLLFVLLGYLIGTWLIRRLLPRLVRRTETTLDDRLLETSGSELRWLVVVSILRFSTNRLNFINADIKTLLTDAYFLLILLLSVLIVWRLIRLAAEQAQDRADKAGYRKEAESLLTLLVWVLRLVLIIFAASLALGHFGVNITGFAVLLSIIGLALSLAARDILADIVSGAMILIDRPYRVGDRIDLPGIDSWGDVVDIGMRSTKVITPNNRMVIVPNSQVGKDQIVNYSYPDPSYYATTHVLVAYDNDADHVGQLLAGAVRQVEGVQKERAISAVLIEFTENHMVFEVGWWIASYIDLFPVRNQVNRAMIQALEDAGIELPYRRTGQVEASSKEQERGQPGF